MITTSHEEEYEPTRLKLPASLKFKNPHKKNQSDKKKNFLFKTFVFLMIFVNIEKVEKCAVKEKKKKLFSKQIEKTCYLSKFLNPEI